jgi:hypothetical protein
VLTKSIAHPEYGTRVDARDWGRSTRSYRPASLLARRGLALNLGQSNRLGGKCAGAAEPSIYSYTLDSTILVYLNELTTLKNCIFIVFTTLKDSVYMGKINSWVF